MPLTEINKKISNLKNVFTILNFESILFEVFKMKENQDGYIKIIQDRLFFKGTDSFEDKLSTDKANRSGNASDFYSDYTVKLKKEKNQKTSNVTLKDSGKFYKSMQGLVSKNEFEVNADFKDIFDNFSQSYSNNKEFQEAILDLTEMERYAFLQVEILPDFITILKRQLTNI